MRQDRVTAEAVQQALGGMQERYAASQPHEQKQLIGLVVRKTTARDREIGLEINGGVVALAAAALR